MWKVSNSMNKKYINQNGFINVIALKVVLKQPFREKAIIA